MPSRQTYREVLQLRADLWRIPFALCVMTLLFFFVTIQIDRAAARGVVTLPAWVSVGGMDDARAILGSMLGAVSTVLALIFSVALLVLSMAVSQFGPRILFWEAVSVTALTKTDHTDIEAAYRRARVALGATL